MLKPISDFLRMQVEHGDVPAVVAAVSDRNGLRYIDAFGKRDVAANIDATPDTIFRIASMTKPITSLAAMMLHEEGSIALDAPVTKYLADYRQPPVFIAVNKDGACESRPAREPIRVHHLLTHTSGISYPYFSPSLARLSRSSTPDPDLPLLHDPGEKWTYGPSTRLLGNIVAEVSGLTLDAFCKERIFDPLGMVDTSYAVPAEKHDRVATYHQTDTAGRLKERPNPEIITSKGRGDDGLFSTAQDYLAFLQLILNRGRAGDQRLVSEAAIEMMTSNQIGGLVIARQKTEDSSLVMPFPLGAGKDNFGFGFQIEQPPSEPGLRSPGSLSWAGVFNTYFWIDPKPQIAAVLMMQLLPALAPKVVDTLRGFERLVYRNWGQ